MTVNYEIIVKSVSEVALFFSNFSDERCDEGTIAGGPGALPVAPGESTTYTCTHLVTEADKTAGLVVNTATDTGTPEDGMPESQTSNPVVVEVPVPKPHVTPEFSCKSVTFNYTGFPNREGDSAVERIKDNGVIIYRATFTFNGPTATHTVFINLGPGEHHLSTTVEYTVNGVKGEHDQGANVTCTAEPEFTVQKKQRIAKSGQQFTTAPLSGHVGQTVEYVITVKNTGNVPLKFSSFTDEGCDAATIKGGPGEAAVAPEGPKTTGKAEWTCSHVLTEADKSAGSHVNQATVTGTPEAGAAKTKSSNTVAVNMS